ncbi:ATP-grasp domain-containing protein [Sporosarcina sp. Sa2YVA2]|uniref:ATP-grasp domain-containing protein n=1 Tax=Sporosarcina quadrami TaxID=2762234 RepID=A0ABR8UDL9_9BACL|nr:ATP-grasp domain-containing protein [Sporosarcina quadrami]MBD7985920.1 ATP-grasp domain-containing protein [Sporosarcina quadrami]
MESILFIESARSGSSHEALAAATRLGFTPVLLTRKKRFSRQLNTTHSSLKICFVEQINESSIRDTIHKHRQKGYTFRAIISFVDPYVSLAATLSNEYCQTAISVEALSVLENKCETRNVLRTNAASIRYEAFTPYGIAPSFYTTVRKYPQILKKATSNGSKDVYIIATAEQMETAIDQILTIGGHEQWLLEEYIEGTQYIIELAVCKGIPIIIAIVQQQITLDVTFVVTGYEVCVTIEPKMDEELSTAVDEIIRDIGLHHGTCHLEMRYTDRGWNLIEINPRIAGGAMNRMVEEAFGISIVEETIKLFIGEKPDFRKKKLQPVYTSYITLAKAGYLLQIDGTDKAKMTPGIIELNVSAAIGSLMKPALSMGYRYGYVMAEGNTQEEAKNRAEHAANLLTFYLEPIE